MKRKVANFVLFQAGWFTCVLAAAAGYEWIGPVAVLMIVVVHLSVIERSWSELMFLLFAGLLGTVLDSVQVWLDAVRFSGTSLFGVLCPLWIIALWFAFSTTLNVSLGRLRRRYGMAAILGLLAGPATYFGASRLGAVVLPDLGFALLTVGIEYAVAMPVLLAVSDRIRQSPASPVETERQTGVLCEPET